MNIFIDSADIQTIEQALKSGYVYGVTTNPTLLQRASVHSQEVPSLAKQIIELGANELHLQVYSEDTSQMCQDAARLVEIDLKRVVVKIPATPAGFAATTQLASHGVRVTLTAVYTVAQAILAQSVGARYIAVYLGRMRDDGLDALALVGQMQRTLNAQRASVEILAASVRSAAEVEAVAELQVAAVTLPLAILQQLPESPGTMAAVEAFTDASKSLQ
ncbi:MAG: transaldolase family protein [Anaerolineales bacterium]|nr:transaldolase family protein [Anaerolineales bacterium]